MTAPARSAKTSFSVDGRAFALELTRTEKGCGILCGSETGGDVLGTVTATAWLKNARGLLKAAEARTGLSFDGDVSFSYHDEFPEETPPGVTLCEFERSETVPEKFFERFIVEFGLACLEADRALGSAAWENLRPELLASRARLG